MRTLCNVFTLDAGRAASVIHRSLTTGTVRHPCGLGRLRAGAKRVLAVSVATFCSCSVAWHHPKIRKAEHGHILTPSASPTTLVPS